MKLFLKMSDYKILYSMHISDFHQNISHVCVQYSTKASP